MKTLKVPVADVYVNQPFGVNYVDFYTKLGLNGHNGLDFKAKIGCPCYAAHAGTVTYAGTDSEGGKCVTLVTSKASNGYKTIYYHLSEIKVKTGDIVRGGQMIGKCGNTGKYTTGAHLHFGLKEIFNNKTVNTNNGYKGAIDPSPFFPKNWDKSNAYHRYGRKGNYWAELKVRFKNPWLHRQLKKRNKLYLVYNNEFINALVYGGWDFEALMNPAMYMVWGWAKKDEFLKGKKNFN